MKTLSAASDPSDKFMLPLPLDPEELSMINHQIRTPLTSIRSFIEILLGYPIDDPDAQRRFLQIIFEETKRLTCVVDTLFGEARSACGNHQVKPSNNDCLPSITTQSFQGGRFHTS